MMASPLPVRCESEKALTNKNQKEARVVSIVTPTQAYLTTRHGVGDTSVLDLRVHFIDDPVLSRFRFEQIKTLVSSMKSPIQSSAEVAERR